MSLQEANGRLLEARAKQRELKRKIAEKKREKETYDENTLKKFQAIKNNIANAKLSSKNTVLQNQMNTKITELANLTSTLDQLNKKCEKQEIENRNKLNASKATIQYYKDSITNDQSNAQSYINEIEQLKQDCSKLQNDIETTNSKIEIAQNEYEEAKNSYEQAYIKLEKRKYSFNVIKSIIGAKKDSIKNLEETMSQISQESSLTNRDNRQKFANAEKRLKLIQEEKTSTEKDVKNLQNLREDLENDLQISSSQLNRVSLLLSNYLAEIKASSNMEQ
ncbi:hypothetical protein TVAG_163470 [Trichomonas vaginalis G3]|uniref:Uncharacterized protein n=1 Tax=Trichomonas vaginalis (strain ATCC PRA-98 / G3) TaxID=412133 RepID=A2DG24_TRIV3|nr:hypothetical protein TVAGG3_0953410 [Trichomonas vaginalis G3]EAY20651.1 hypothetical protein TVAG_163470 [Trichomonas vaginalis G3]KAI5487372.1 hypothetical protein TVAGG3_0953410 [Trichomonas vaginalis G3]|eukprot:XP_001581637.1 hypothetical protein [Trichomonas vaginalis G3]